MQTSLYNVFKNFVPEENFIIDYLTGTNRVEQELYKTYGPDMLSAYRTANATLDKYTIAQYNEKDAKQLSAKTAFKETKKSSASKLDQIIELMAQEKLKNIKDEKEELRLLGAVNNYTKNRKVEVGLLGKPNFSKEFAAKLKKAALPALLLEAEEEEENKKIKQTEHKDSEKQTAETNNVYNEQQKTVKANKLQNEQQKKAENDVNSKKSKRNNEQDRVYTDGEDINIIDGKAIIGSINIKGSGNIVNSNGVSIGKDAEGIVNINGNGKIIGGYRNFVDEKNTSTRININNRSIRVNGNAQITSINENGMVINGKSIPFTGNKIVVNGDYVEIDGKPIDISKFDDVAKAGKQTTQEPRSEQDTKNYLTRDENAKNERNIIGGNSVIGAIESEEKGKGKVTVRGNERTSNIINDKQKEKNANESLDLDLFGWDDLNLDNKWDDFMQYITQGVTISGINQQSQNIRESMKQFRNSMQQLKQDMHKMKDDMRGMR